MRLLALWLFFALALAQTYTVKPGDTLYRIAKAHGLTVAELMRLNGLTSERIYPGQVLRVGWEGPKDPGAASSKKASPSGTAPASTAKGRPAAKSTTCTPSPPPTPPSPSAPGCG
jgi:murein DD-endopeptidase MepM/ murein hydrolase activator NlpD